MTQYQRLFTLRITHAYFDTSVYPELHLRPTGPTAGWMRQLGLLMRGKEGSWEVFAGSESPIWTFAKPPGQQEEMEDLIFEISCSDPYFAGFTDLPLDLPGRLIYSSEQVSHSPNGVLLLAPRMADENFQPNLGLVRIQWDSLFTELEQSAEVNFVISFENRSVYWKYHVIYKSMPSMEPIGINGEDGLMAFSGPKEKRLNQGEIAWVYTSKSAILLHQIPPHSPQLRYRSNGTVHTLTLPVPTRNGIRFGEIDGTVQAIANMYIYV